LEKLIQEYVELWEGCPTPEDVVDNILDYEMWWLPDGMDDKYRDWEGIDLPLWVSWLLLNKDSLPSNNAHKLDKVILRWQEYRKRGLFFLRFRMAYLGNYCSWKEYRQDAEKEIGVPIPRSHWWFWPTLDEEEQKYDKKE